MDREMLIPHLKTANSDLYQIEKKILEKQVKIERWFREVFLKEASLLTTSVDLRNAGYKLAPVDTNLFPAGFNNLNPDLYPLCIQAFQSAMEKLHSSAQRIMLIPENHTRNPFYLESLGALFEIISKSGFEVRIASLLDIHSPKEIKLDSGKTLILYPLKREKRKLYCDGFCPDVILLNNDLSGGIPEILENIQQVMTPLPKLSWAHRYKSEHFGHYSKVCDDFSKVINIDPWEICPLFEDCGEINFLDGGGEECLIAKTNQLFKRIEKKYQENKINEKPFVVIKAEQGTYGMAVMMIESVQEILSLNRKQRQSMGKTKGGQIVDRVIIQEGIYTLETVGPNADVAEPVVYMIGQNVVGGFYRVHIHKSPKENLNAPGMHFEPFAFESCGNTPDDTFSSQASPNRFYAYSVIARLAYLATCLEHKVVLGADV